ncbi:MAG: low affinity iron permease family protein [Deltaproteobacteria bacterium]|nr:low affinity iron permease family protein [Deltaproteobacteria bacterium]
MSDVFHRAARKVSTAAGNPLAFAVAAGGVVLWLVTGPMFHYSDTWQLVINTATTIITFLMVFMIQETQNRDSKAIHLKLDELLRAVETARTRLVDLEDMTDEELKNLELEFRRLRMEEARS